MSQALEKLKGGDLRSIGKSNEVVQDILKTPSLFGEVFEGLLADDQVLRMRCADVIEKVSKVHLGYLQPYKDRLIKEVSKVNQQEVRWHLAQIFSYLELDREEITIIVDILSSWINSEKSKIVIVNSIQTLAEFAKKDKSIRPMVLRKLEDIIKNSSPLVVSRGNKLIKELKRL